MGGFCAAIGCTNSSAKAKKVKHITFHSFPIKRPEVLKQWYLQLKRKDFVATVHSVLCSEHFCQEDFDFQPFTNRRQLKKTAIPTRFDFSGTTKGTKKVSDTDIEMNKKSHCKKKPSTNDERPLSIKQEYFDDDDDENTRSPIYDRNCYNSHDDNECTNSIALSEHLYPVSLFKVKPQELSGPQGISIELVGCNLAKEKLINLDHNYVTRPPSLMEDDQDTTEETDSLNLDMNIKEEPDDNMEIKTEVDDVGPDKENIKQQPSLSETRIKIEVDDDEPVRESESQEPSFDEARIKIEVDDDEPVEKSVSQEPSLNDARIKIEVDDDDPVRESESQEPSFDEARIKTEVHDNEPVEKNVSQEPSLNEASILLTPKDLVAYLEKYKEIHGPDIKYGHIAWLLISNQNKPAAVSRVLCAELQKCGGNVKFFRDILPCKILKIKDKFNYLKKNLTKYKLELLLFLEQTFVLPQKSEKKPADNPSDNVSLSAISDAPLPQAADKGTLANPVENSSTSAGNENSSIPAECQKCLSAKRTYESLMQTYQTRQKALIEAKRECFHTRIKHKYSQVKKKVKSMKDRLYKKNAQITSLRKTCKSNKKLLLDLATDKGQIFKSIRYYKRALQEEFGVSDDMFVHTKPARKKINASKKVQKVPKSSKR
ncbi:uncharacterized protein LOC131957433 isoform X2 [Physella acuta]|uniref:uncharacterized protein LOC131957433 isoform X2 n=1 Tax=Physella acuta TaxID=109671 RepID=UPI0027DD6028|nr:uncharacterized protein LOC131957433 isoform X2 [Physella acuta]